MATKKPWRTYGKKKKALLPPDEQFNIEVEQSKLDMPLLRASSRSSDKIGDLADELLEFPSPVQSDNSSSIKSIEPAMERRVSHLLRGESNRIVSKPLDTSRKPLEHLSEVTANLSSQSEDANAFDESSFKHFSLARLPDIERPLSRGANSTSISANSKNGGTFNKRMSGLLNKPQGPVTKSVSGAFASWQSRNLSPLRSGIEASRRIMQQAKSAVTRSPVKSNQKPRKGKGREISTDQYNLLEGLKTGHNRGSYSLTSLFFNTSESKIESSLAEQGSLIQCEPQSSTSSCQQAHARITPVDRAPDLPLMHRLNAGANDAEHDNKTARRRRAPVGRIEMSTRLSATTPNEEDLPELERRFSAESETSHAVSISTSQFSNQKIKPSTLKPKSKAVSALLGSDSSDYRAGKTQRPKRGLHIQMSSKNTQVEITSRNSTLRRNNATALSEKDTNQRIHMTSEDDSSVKIARAMRLSVSPKVKEVINRLPKKRSSIKTPRVIEVVLPKTSSKASHILGHHVGSREPLRPPRGDQVTAQFLDENTSSEDELAS